MHAVVEAGGRSRRRRLPDLGAGVLTPEDAAAERRSAGGGGSVVCGPHRQCPISGGACPGSCIFADVMESQSLGVVVLELAHEDLVFANRAARALFERLGLTTEFRTVSDLLLPSGDGTSAAGFNRAQSRRVGDRLLGYTVYRAGAFAWALLRDITDKERLESVAQAVESMNNIGYVFSAVRHELGNPVNSVKAALSLVRENLDTYPRETVRDYLDRIASEMSRVENLLRSLKSFSLYETPDVQRVDLCAWVHDFAALVSTEAANRGVAFEVECGPSCIAACDPRALQHVLLNLFANAADALHGRHAPRIRASISAADGLVWIRFEDNGAGMSEDQMRNVFKPFHTTKESGTGLGLVIARKLLARMGGTIHVESRPGEGTTFVMTLPKAGERK